MEIGSISQGGQTNLDFSTVEKAQNTQNINVNASIENKTKQSSEQNSNGEKKVSEKEVSKAVDKLNKLLEDTDTHVEYEVHKELKDIMIKIVDNKTNRVIQEIPPKKILDMVAKLCELAGVLLDKRA